MNKGLSKVIDITRSLKESPTMSVGDGGYTNSATASGPVSGYDAPLPLPTLDQDYQTPGQSGLAKYRFSNVYPAQNVTNTGVDNMVGASSEYLKLADEGYQRNTEERVNRIPVTGQDKQKKRQIVIGLGASGDNKRWPTSNFIKFI